MKPKFLHNIYVSYNFIRFGIVICIYELLSIFWTYKCHSYRWHSIYFFMIKAFPYWIKTFYVWLYPSLLYITKNTWGSYLTVTCISVNPSMRLCKKIYIKSKKQEFILHYTYPIIVNNYHNEMLNVHAYSVRWLITRYSYSTLVFTIKSFEK